MTFPPVVSEYRVDIAATLAFAVGGLAWYRRIKLPSRIALYHALGKHCMVKEAGLVAQREAEVAARGKEVRLG